MYIYNGCTWSLLAYVLSAYVSDPILANQKAKICHDGVDSVILESKLSFRG